MARLKRIFISFAMEDEWARNMLRGQSKLGDSPIEYADFSVKEPWDSAWQTKCRTRIKGCDGVIAFISSNTKAAAGARWEIGCAVEEGVPIIGVYAQSTDTAYRPPELAGKKVILWTWPGIAGFVNGLP